MSEAALDYATIPIGLECQTESLPLSQAAIIDFAQQFDPQPMHLDAAAAADSFFGTLVASGWHVLCATMRLLVLARPFGATPLIGVELGQVRLRRPVPAGTIITASLKVTGKRRANSRPELGFISALVTTCDETGTVLAEQEWTLLVPASPGEI